MNIMLSTFLQKKSFITLKNVSSNIQTEDPATLTIYCRSSVTDECTHVFSAISIREEQIFVRESPHDTISIFSRIYLNSSRARALQRGQEIKRFRTNSKPVIIRAGCRYR